MKYKLFYRGDCLIYIAVLLLLAFSFFPFLLRKSGSTVLISTPHEQQTFSLSENRTVELNSAEYSLTVLISDGSVRVIRASCPDRTCMHTPPISKSAESIVCLPAGVLIQIQGERSDGLDEIAG